MISNRNKRWTWLSGDPTPIDYPAPSSVAPVVAFSWVIGGKGVSNAIQIGVRRSNRGIRRRNNDDAKFRPWRLSYWLRVRRLQSLYYADVDADPSQPSRRRKWHYRRKQGDKQRMAYIVYKIEKMCLFVLV